MQRNITYPSIFRPATPRHCLLRRLRLMSAIIGIKIQKQSAIAYRDWYRVLCDGGLLLNFDSDYGPVRFTSAASEEKNIHHDVDSDLIRECESLKDALAISRECRPAWDLYRLQDIGFTDCQCAEDIRPMVHVSASMQYDSAPLFCLSAHKNGLAWCAH